MKAPTPSWLTGKADAASMASLVDRVSGLVDVATIDELWLFPTRRAAGVESTVFVLSVQEPGDRRAVITAHVRAIRNKRGEPAIETKVDEHATAPPERLPFVIEGVLHRLSDDFAATPPSHARIDGSAERWQALVEALMVIKANEPLPEELLPEANNDLDD
jgi:hypothetical protein